MSIYEVADSKLLVGLQKGIFVEDVMRFLNDQHDVREYEWNGKAYSAEHKNKRQGHRKRHNKGTNKRQRKKTAEGPGKHPASMGGENIRTYKLTSRIQRNPKR